MNSQLAVRLDTLNSNYESVVGHPFRYFLCPILGTDEDEALCQGHVVNKAFPGTDRSWTVQRTDVDARFGSLFESNFAAIESVERSPIEEALTDKAAARTFKPALLVDGSPIDSYISRRPLPAEHTGISLDVNGSTVPLALKIPQEEVAAALDATWEFRIERDFRLAYMASILKAAHLTMFHLQGYRYALSETGRFLGRCILGEILVKTSEKDRPQALRVARDHFRPYAPMVRPINAVPWELKGTVTDRYVLACMSGSRPWAYIVLSQYGSSDACRSLAYSRGRWIDRSDKVVEMEFAGSISLETVRQILKKTNSSRGRKRNGASPS